MALGLVVVTILLIMFYLVRLYRQKSRQLAFIESYSYLKLISPKLRESLSYVDDAQWPMVARGLRQYFILCHKAKGRMVAMPSDIVDDLWHEFILNTRAYQAFCKQAFGRFLHHVPAQGMSSPTSAQESIKRAWRLACEVEYINPKTPSRLPILFAIDSLLKVPNGFYYSLDCQANKEESAAGCGGYCATHIGCGGGGGCSSNSGSSGDSGCSGGCGGGD